MIYETSYCKTVTIRVHANSATEADEIFDEFETKESDYLTEELDLNGLPQRTPFMEVHPAPYDECATITKNEDGTFDAMYEGGEDE